MTSPGKQHTLELAERYVCGDRVRFLTGAGIDLVIGRRQGYHIWDVDGRELDSFRVSIELPPNYPEDLPVVREVGGRLDWKSDLHINPENSEAPGTACVLIPDDRWQCFPIGSRFRVYLEGPLHNFFLAQHCVAKGEPWPFGQWDHGERGVYEYYRWLIPTESNEVVRRFLHLLAKLELKEQRKFSDSMRLFRSTSLRILSLPSLPTCTPRRLPMVFLLHALEQTVHLIENLHMT